MSPESFTRQFLPLHPKLYRIACALLEDEAHARDILQDAYCKLWDKREDLQKIQNPEAYCVIMVKNLCIDFIRSARQRQQKVQARQIQEPATTEGSPESQTIAREQIALMDKLITTLPASQRSVLRLKAANSSTEEIALITGFSPLHIRVLLSRARKTLRAQFLNLQYHDTRL